MVQWSIPPGYAAYAELPSPFGPIPTWFWPVFLSGMVTAGDQPPGKRKRQAETSGTIPLSPLAVPAAPPRPPGAPTPACPTNAAPEDVQEAKERLQTCRKKKPGARADGTRYRSPATRRRSARRAAEYRRAKAAERRGARQLQPEAEAPACECPGESTMEVDEVESGACPAAAGVGGIDELD